jgi:hypothetical protein
MLNSHRPRFRPLLLAGAAAGVLLVPLVLAWTGWKGPPCLFRAAYGLPCPGCGFTRSILALWNLDLAASFRYHPLGAPLFVVCAGFLLGRAAASVSPAAGIAWRRLTRPLAPARNRLWTTAAALLVGIWGLRLALTLAGSRFFLW